MAKVKRIRIEIVGNENLHLYHVTTQITSEEVYGGFLGGNRLDPFHTFRFSDEAPKEFTEDTKSTVNAFYDVDGINEVGIKPNEVRITRSPAYEWDEIEDEILDTIKKVAGWNDDDVQVDYLFAGRVYSEPIPREVYEREMDRREEEARRADRMFGGF